MDRKSKKGIFVGYDIDTPGFRVYVKDIDDVVSSSNIEFDEETGVDSFTELGWQATYNKDKRISQKDLDVKSEGESEDEDESDQSTEDGSFQSTHEAVSSSEEENSEVSTTRVLRDRRNIRPPKRYGGYVVDTGLMMHEIRSEIFGEVKLSVQEALKNPKWRDAMLDEMKSLTEMETWSLVRRPQSVSPLTCRWVFCIKDSGRYKARLVVRGFEQMEGRDYFEIFSPVARHMSIRLILSIAASENMKIITFDIKTAFLHGELEETIFMYQPEGFTDNTGRICLLKKSLYGLKQAPKVWNNTFTKFLKSLKFEPSDDDPCVYYNRDRTIITILHVDDGLMIGKDAQIMIKVMEEMNKVFKLTYTTDSQVFPYLGMEIQPLKKGIFINQSKYVDKILKRFDYQYVNPVSTPIERGMVTNPENCVNDKSLCKYELYREAIGSLLYLATISRPDISFCVNYLSRFNSKPMESHWKMAKRIFQYVKGTKNFGIFFDGNQELIGYSDSDYGGDQITGHSTSGVLVLRGGPVVWFTQKQRLVANSTAEAEYRAAVSALDDISWIRRLANELGKLDLNQPTTLCIDNQSAIHMLKNTHEGKTTKGKKTYRDFKEIYSATHWLNSKTSIREERRATSRHSYKTVV